MHKNNKLKQLIGLVAFVASVSVNAVEIGQTAPDFTLKSLAHDNLNLQEQRGDIVVINFWASWCGPCRKEMPVLEQLQQKYQDLGVQIWGVNVEQDNQAGRNFLKDMSLTFPILFDPNNQLSESYNVVAMPTTVVVDRNGTVREIYRGYKDGYGKKYEKALKKLIRQ